MYVLEEDIGLGRVGHLGVEFFSLLHFSDWHLHASI
jgi:hypothetical protein